VVHPSLPVKSVRDLIALARARPGDLNYSAGTPGGSSTLAGALLKSMAGINIVAIPYTGNGPALTAAMSGEVQMTILDAGTVTPLVKSGRLNALAVTSATPSALAPGLPTLAASGVPGYEAIGMTSVFAPARTPPAIIARLNQEIVRFLGRPEVRERFLNAGSEIVASSPEQLTATMKNDMAKWAKVVREAGLRAN
jgi:tripartite-type tricarboxylate transporter receptor subunit TctC